jgi:hypothetical protein
MSPASSNAFARPLRVELGASRRIAAVLCGACTLAMLAAMPLAGPLHAAFCAAALMYYRHLYRIHARPAANQAVRALAWDPQHGWRLRLGRGWCEGRLLQPVFVTHRLVALRFAGPGRRRHRVIVTGDRLDAGNFRRLRVRLLQCVHAGRDRTQIPGSR